MFFKVRFYEWGLQIERKLGCMFKKNMFLIFCERFKEAQVTFRGTFILINQKINTCVTELFYISIC